MKAAKLFMVSAMLVATSAIGQKEKSSATKKKKDTVQKQQDNFMDMLSGTLTGTFGENLDGNTMGLGKGIGFLELLEKTNLTPKEKAEYRMVYLTQSKELPKEKRDSLGSALFKKMMEAELKKPKK